MQNKYLFKNYFPFNIANHQKIIRKIRIFGNCIFFKYLKYTRIYV